MNTGRFERPWGWYEVLSLGEGFQVKTIGVAPGQRLSLQSHEHREETWVVVRGCPVVVLEHSRISLRPGQTVFVPRGSRHRLENPGTDEVLIVEVQQGAYLGEDDIVRYEDDYQRVVQTT